MFSRELGICQIIQSQAWRSEEEDLGRFGVQEAAEAETATLDVASGVAGRTRVDTVRERLEEGVMKLVLGDA